MAAASDAPRAPEPNETRRPRFFSRQYVVGVGIALVVIGAVAGILRHQKGSERRRQEAILKSILDRVVTAEEGFYFDSSHYTASLQALPTVRLPSGVRLQLHTSDRRSWWGIATHDQLPARHCLVWVGVAPATLPPDARAPEDETKPLCFDNARVLLRPPSVPEKPQSPDGE